MHIVLEKATESRDNNRVDKGEEKPDTSRVCQIKLEAVTSTSSKIREVIEIYPHTLNTSMSSSRMNSPDRYGRERERERETVRGSIRARWPSHSLITRPSESEIHSSAVPSSQVPLAAGATPNPSIADTRERERERESTRTSLFKTLSAQ